MKKSKVIIGLSNPKSPTNVGSVMRAAGCYAVDDVFYTGQRYERAMKFNTDTRNASQNIALIGVEALLDDIPNDVTVVCVELVEGAVPLPEYQHPGNAFYIFGPEDGNISQDLIDQADDVVYIPTIGCMNLAATVNVVLYDRMAKSELSISSDDLVRASRDTNNRLRVKPLE
ncbi:MAG: RNA methyltransferase [Gammaproteobacteria bacterium]|nr:RNA methyltransferase [Gammaproteobacteria bacterium]